MTLQGNESYGFLNVFYQTKGFFGGISTVDLWLYLTSKRLLKSSSSHLSSETSAPHAPKPQKKTSRQWSMALFTRMLRTDPWRLRYTTKSLRCDERQDCSNRAHRECLGYAGVHFFVFLSCPKDNPKWIQMDNYHETNMMNHEYHCLTFGPGV